MIPVLIAIIVYLFLYGLVATLAIIGALREHEEMQEKLDELRRGEPVYR